MAEKGKAAEGHGKAELVHAEAFEPGAVRPWRFHNRTGSGMDDASLDALAASIRRDGQQQLGLARRLPAGDTHAVEAIFGIRRLEACRRIDVPWRAEVLDATTSDAHCAALMYGENEWSEGVSPMENAFQWKAMLDAGVFVNQSALAVDLGCHRGTVSRAVRTATALFEAEWIDRLTRPVMHQFTGRSADRLADALADPERQETARRRAQDLVPGLVEAQELFEALLGDRPARSLRQTVFVRRKGRAGGGLVTAKIERDGAGGFTVSVRPHDQTAVELAELAGADRGPGINRDCRRGRGSVRTASGLVVDARGGEGCRSVLVGGLRLVGGPSQRFGLGPLAMRGGGGCPANPAARMGAGDGARGRRSSGGSRRKLGGRACSPVAFSRGVLTDGRVLSCAHYSTRHGASGQVERGLMA